MYKSRSRRALCHLCGESGPHGSVDECLGALRVAVDRARALYPVPPAEERTTAEEPPHGPARIAIRVLRSGKGAPLVERLRTVHTLAEALEWVALARVGHESCRFYIDSVSLPARVRNPRPLGSHRPRRQSLIERRVPISALVQDVEAALQRVFDSSSSASLG
jgi:hypothetical protein